MYATSIITVQYVIGTSPGGPAFSASLQLLLKLKMAKEKKNVGKLYAIGLKVQLHFFYFVLRQQNFTPKNDLG